MIMQAHYIKGFFRLFAVIAVGFVAIFGLFDLVSIFAKLSDYDPPSLMVLEYWVYGLPRHLVSLMPICVLMAGVFTIGKAAKDRELVAFMASGGRLKRLLIPFVLTGMLLSIASFALQEIIVPALSSRAAVLKDEITGVRKLPAATVEGATWMRARDGSFVRMGLHLHDKDLFSGISIYSGGAEGFDRIITAEFARYLSVQDGWMLYNASSYEGSAGLSRRWAELPFESLNPPADFSGFVKKPYEMSIFELRQYLGQMKASGFHNLRLEVEMHSKVSYPLINIIVMVFGVAFAATRTMGGLFAAAFSLLFTLAYWFGYTLSLTLGFAGILPPLAAVWIMPVFFGGLSAWMYARIAE